MDAAESEQRHKPQATADVRQVGCKHLILIEDSPSA
jgi:hypothetical protein